jgi:hypothetical protein
LITSLSYYIWADDSPITQFRIWVNKVVPPIAIALSIPASYISCLIFALHGCGLPINVRFYYSAIAFADAGAMCSLLLLQYITNVLPYTSMPLPFNNTLFCKLSRTFSTACYQSSTFTMAYFAIDRVYLVRNPMKAKFSNFNRNMTYGAALVITVCVLSNLYVLVYSDVFPIREPPHRICSQVISSIGGIVNSYSVVWLSLLPVSIELGCNVTLCVILAAKKRQRAHMVLTKQRGDTELSKSELSTTVTLISIGLVHAAVLLNETTFWLIFTTLAVFSNLPIGVISMWYSGALAATLCDMPILSLVDFAIYAARIPSYRQVLLRFCWPCNCKLSKPTKY